VNLSNHPTLIRRQQQVRLKRLAQAKPFVAASLVHIGVRCGRAGCHCATGPGHPSFYLTLRHEGKTKTVYVPKHQLAEVRQWVEEHRRLKRVLREISELSLALLRAEARVRRDRKRRRSTWGRS
jgi:hypothetical protein